MTQGFEKLCRVLVRCPLLNHLDLENNSIGGHGFEKGLLMILKPQLTYLNLS